MKQLSILAIFLFVVFQANAQTNGIFNVRDFGASGEKKTMAKEAIQRAIDRCAASGGGKVYFPAGEYLSGPLMLKSNVNLYLESGATLLASRNVDDYPADPNYKADQQSQAPFKAIFIRAENLENIAITGLGTIDGQAEQVWQPLAEIDQFIARETEIARGAGIPMERAYQKDPKVWLVYLMFCSNVTIQGVTIKKSPDWNLHLGRCRDGAKVSNVKFTNIVLHCSRKHFNWWGNGDPIWLVVLKRNADSPVGKIQDVVFENITASGEGTSKVEGFEGSPLENIQYRNVKIEMNPESLPDKRATHGFMAHDVGNLSMTDFEIDWNEKQTEPNWESAFVFEDIKDLLIDRLIGKQAPGTGEPAILLDNIKDGLIERCIASKGAKTFMKISGKNTSNMDVNNNYLEVSDKRLEISPEVPSDQVLITNFN